MHTSTVYAGTANCALTANSGYGTILTNGYFNQNTTLMREKLPAKVWLPDYSGDTIESLIDLFEQADIEWVMV